MLGVFSSVQVAQVDHHAHYAVPVTVKDWQLSHGCLQLLSFLPICRFESDTCDVSGKFGDTYGSELDQNENRKEHQNFVKMKEKEWPLQKSVGFPYFAWVKAQFRRRANCEP